MNNEPLGYCSSLQALRRWMNETGMSSWWDISVWQDSCWDSWNLQTPLELFMEREILLSKLHGLAPMQARNHDSRGWGAQAGGYTITHGYAKLCESPHVATNPEPWKGIWHNPSVES